jgi:hypothetical protein
VTRVIIYNHLWYLSIEIFFGQLSIEMFQKQELLGLRTSGWHVPVVSLDSAKKIVGKFKNLRRVLRAWQANLPSLAKTIENNKNVLSFIDSMEEFRGLTLEEWNFRKVIQYHLENLLDQQRVYWMQRGKIKWVTLGDENTIFS